MPNILPDTFADLNDITTASKGVVALYARRAIDGALVAIEAAPGGGLAVGNPQGSDEAFFADQATQALSGTFVSIPFGFTSFNITLINDDGAEVIEFSFDGVSTHGKIFAAEGLSQDYRAQPSIYLKTSSGNPANYRLMVY